MPRAVTTSLILSRFRERFTNINKQVLDGQKAQQKLESKKALEAITSYFQAPENQDKSSLVASLPISANSKAVSESLNYVKSKLQDKTVYLLAADPQQGRVAHGCHVSEVRFSFHSLSNFSLS